MSLKQVLFTIVILAGLGFLVWQYFPRQLSVSKPAAQSQTWETKTDEQGPVAVKVTPLELSEGAAAWKFKITFDTHSGELTDDPLRAVTLVDDRGNVFVPLAWDGPGGHHREGILAFSAINLAPASVELKIKNVGGIPERVLRWNLEKK